MIPLNFNSPAASHRSSTVASTASEAMSLIRSRIDHLLGLSSDSAALRPTVQKFWICAEEIFGARLALGEVFFWFTFQILSVTFMGLCVVDRFTSLADKLPQSQPFLYSTGLISAMCFYWVPLFYYSEARLTTAIVQLKAVDPKAAVQHEARVYRIFMVWVLVLAVNILCHLLRQPSLILVLMAFGAPLLAAGTLMQVQSTLRAIDGAEKELKHLAAVLVVKDKLHQANRYLVNEMNKHAHAIRRLRRNHSMAMSGRLGYAQTLEATVREVKCQLQQTQEALSSSVERCSDNLSEMIAEQMIDRVRVQSAEAEAIRLRQTLLHREIELFRVKEKVQLNGKEKSQLIEKEKSQLIEKEKSQLIEKEKSQPKDLEVQSIQHAAHEKEVSQLRRALIDAREDRESYLTLLKREESEKQDLEKEASQLRRALIDAREDRESYLTLLKREGRDDQTLIDINKALVGQLIADGEDEKSYIELLRREEKENKTLKRRNEVLTGRLQWEMTASKQSNLTLRARGFEIMKVKEDLEHAMAGRKYMAICLEEAVTAKEEWEERAVEAERCCSAMANEFDFVKHDLAAQHKTIVMLHGRWKQVERERDAAKELVRTLETKFLQSVVTIDDDEDSSDDMGSVMSLEEDTSSEESSVISLSEDDGEDDDSLGDEASDDDISVFSLSDGAT